MHYADNPMANISAEDYQKVLHDLASQLTPILRRQAFQVVTSALEFTWAANMTAREWAHQAANHLRIDTECLTFNRARPLILDPATKLHLMHMADEYADRTHRKTGCAKSVAVMRQMIEREEPQEAKPLAGEILNLLIYQGYTVMEFDSALKIVLETIAHKDGWTA